MGKLETKERKYLMQTVPSTTAREMADALEEAFKHIAGCLYRAAEPDVPGATFGELCDRLANSAVTIDEFSSPSNLGVSRG